MIDIWLVFCTILNHVLSSIIITVAVCLGIKLILYGCSKRNQSGLHIAFFHPYCNAGGGGERVLWCAIRAVQKRFPDAKCYVYTGDTDVTPEGFIEKAQVQFNITITKPVRFIYLKCRTLLEARHYPYFTLLMQSLASTIVGIEALLRFVPDIYFDTMGYAFTYPVFRYLGSCKVSSYTHYPTISVDMLSVVEGATIAHNNRSFIAQSSILTSVKLVYYRLFALLYGLVGSCADVVLVNSSWTSGHIKSLFSRTKIYTVFPPCDTQAFINIPLISNSEKSSKTIVSIGQFRPEKDHPLQLRSFHKLLELLLPEEKDSISLVLIGGCRNEDDEIRVKELKNLADSLGIADKIKWKINITFKELLSIVQDGTIGLHTMWNEHFGISVVESMAGGLITIAHNSGGPLMDIIQDYGGKVTGFLAAEENDYARTMLTVLRLSNNEKKAIQANARLSVQQRFSDDHFENTFILHFQEVV